MNGRHLEKERLCSGVIFWIKMCRDDELKVKEVSYFLLFIEFDEETLLRIINERTSDFVAPN